MIKVCDWGAGRRAGTAYIRIREAEICFCGAEKALKNKNARQNCGERRHLFSTDYSIRLENNVKCYFRLFSMASKS
jgi:hypothetical protein